MIYVVKFVGYNDQFRCETREEVLRLIDQHLKSEVVCDVIIKMRSEKHA